MENRPPMQIDMTLDGRILPPRRPSWIPRIVAVAVLLAAAAGGLAISALALWLALTLIPVAIAAVLVAVLALKFQAWRGRRGQDVRRV